MIAPATRATFALVALGLVLTPGPNMAYLAARPFWARVQRWVMGGMLGALAVRMAAESRR